MWLRSRRVRFPLSLLSSPFLPLEATEEILTKQLERTDGSAHDVTPRYAHSFTNTTLKLRVPTSTVVRKANGGGDWFAGVVAPWKRAFQLVRPPFSVLLSASV